MPEQKIDNLLNLAMDAMPREREKSGNLNVGYQAETRLWEVIVKYSGQEEGLSGEGISVVPLLGGYAVVTIPETEIDAFSRRTQVETEKALFCHSSGKTSKLYFLCTDWQRGVKRRRNPCGGSRFGN